MVVTFGKGLSRLGFVLGHGETGVIQTVVSFGYLPEPFTSVVSVLPVYYSLKFTVEVG